MPDDSSDGGRGSGSIQPVKNWQRDPQVFSGYPNDDVDGSMTHYERVNAHNNWNDTDNKTEPE